MQDKTMQDTKYKTIPYNQRKCNIIQAKREQIRQHNAIEDNTRQDDALQYKTTQ